MQATASVSVGTRSKERVPSFTLAVMRRLDSPNTADDILLAGYEDGRAGVPCPDPVCRDICEVRRRFGFADRVADLLTPPDAQHKLDMAVIPSYGMTLAHADLSGHELCPWRTKSCTFCCVVSNGNGRYESVQRAWLWRTTLWLEFTDSAAYRMGWELGRAVRKHGWILFRPDINSDAAWHRIFPVLGHLNRIQCYGYTKNPAVLDSNHWVDGWLYGFRYAYSWNEKSSMARVRSHLLRGGAVAVVTNRKKGQEPNAVFLRSFFDMPNANVVDADLSDEWMLERQLPVIGDLTAKGKARQLIGKSGFVVVTHG